MFGKKLKKNFVSDIDIALANFKQNHPRTREQEAEWSKHQKIYQRRDAVSQAAPSERSAEEQQQWGDF